MNTAQSDQSCQLETLEDRQLFSAMGTMNIIDAGVAPSVITSYTLNGVKDYADAGVSNWTRSATNPGTFAGSPTPGEKFGVFCLEPDQEICRLDKLRFHAPRYLGPPHAFPTQYTG